MDATNFDIIDSFAVFGCDTTNSGVADFEFAGAFYLPYLKISINGRIIYIDFEGCFLGGNNDFFWFFFFFFTYFNSYPFIILSGS